jgi:hypothetical protein
MILMFFKYIFCAKECKAIGNLNKCMKNTFIVCGVLKTSSGLSISLWSFPMFSKFSFFQPGRAVLWSAALVSAMLLASCGGGGGGGGGGDGGGNSSVTGSVVYLTTAQVNGRTERVIKVMNIATRAEIQFVAGSFVEGGPSVSQTGTIAFMTEGDDNVTINFHRLNGQFISRFNYAERVSFPISGAVISPDGRRVAFAQNRLDDVRGREDAVYVCNTTGQPNCIYYFNLRDPAWLGNSKVVSVSGNDRNRLFTIDVTNNRVVQVGPTSATQINNPVGTPDAQTIIYAGDVAVNKLVAMNVATGVTRDISRGGTGQYAPRVSPDGSTLGYIELCCGGGPNRGALRAAPLNLNAVFEGGVNTNLVRDAAGGIIFLSGAEFGVTAAVN